MDEIPASSDKRLCQPDQEATILIFGSNFGLTPPTISIVEDESGKTKPCVIKTFTHYYALVSLPPGFGNFRVSLSSIQGGISFPRIAYSEKMRYSPPKITSVAWGDSIDSMYATWSFNGIGTTPENGAKLFIFGENFGDEPSIASVNISGRICKNAVWHKPSRSATPKGTPYIVSMHNSNLLHSHRINFEGYDLIHF